MSRNAEEIYMKKVFKKIGFIFLLESGKLREMIFWEVEKMIERKVILKNKTGLHARPASEVVAYAKQLPCKVYISHNGKKAAADSILQLLTLGAKEGSELMLSAEGEGDKHSVEKLEAFLNILEG